MGGNNKIPDRWMPYSCVGKQIRGTRFLAFKVPLKEQISYRVETSRRFTPMNLIEQVPNLGLVIDLTNTNRYYDQREITSHGVQYLKVACVGRLLPSEAVLQKFIKAVDAFLEENADNDKLIGVHCTHGVNRTGFFICKYMIDKMNYNPLIAIKEFDEARGHKMERDIYIDELVNPKIGKSDLPIDLPIDSHTNPKHPNPHDRLMELKSLKDNLKERRSKNESSLSFYPKVLHNEPRSSSIIPQRSTQHLPPNSNMSRNYTLNNFKIPRKNHNRHDYDDNRNNHNRHDYDNNRNTPSPRQINAVRGPYNAPGNYYNHNYNRNNLSSHRNNTHDANRQYSSQSYHSNRFYNSTNTNQSSSHNVNNSQSYHSQRSHNTSTKWYQNTSRLSQHRPP